MWTDEDLATYLWDCICPLESAVLTGSISSVGPQGQGLFGPRSSLVVYGPSRDQGPAGFTSIPQGLQVRAIPPGLQLRWQMFFPSGLPYP